MAGHPWIDGLDEEDLAFIKRFILASGSLKDTARSYSVSYPTVRLRLDRLIAKIRVLDEGREQSRFETLLRSKFAEGKIDIHTMKSLLQAFRDETGDQP